MVVIGQEARTSTSDRALRSYVDWLACSALPVWADRGFDRSSGRFREQLDPAGRPLDVPHRSMVQARQIYVYCHAALLGWFPDGASLAEQAMASLLRDFCDEQRDHASFAFSIQGTGAVTSSARDAYAHAFVLLAFAWLYRLNGDARLLILADKTLAFIDGHLLDPENGGLLDQWPATDRYKRQNPLMHLLEACIFLEQAAPGQGYLTRAARLVQLFKERLFKAEHGVLLEHFNEDWSVHPDDAKARLFEPGHHMEWVWLLTEYSRLSGENIAPWRKALFETCLSHGTAPTGLLFDEVALDGTVISASHRIWPHTEAMKAGVAIHGAEDGSGKAFAGRMAMLLLENFLDRPFSGGWTDRIHSDGTALIGNVPASSLYHLFLAGAETAKAFGTRPAIREHK